MYANIIIDITHEKIDKVFQYCIPTELKDTLVIGMEVVVPFGRGNSEKKGYVVGIENTCNYELHKIKSILRVEENSIAMEARLVTLAAWIKEHYGGTMIQALKAVLPIKQQEKIKEKREVRLCIDKKTGEKQLAYYLEKNQRARARLLAALLDAEVLDYNLIIKKLSITRVVIKALEEQGVLTIETSRVYRNPIKRKIESEQAISYTIEQKRAIEMFWNDYEQNQLGTYLVHGVTGSGKTEVYMEMIGRVIAKGKQAIVLIPEIALTYQTVMRFYKRFGDRVSIMNSRLSKGERYDQSERAKKGEIDVCIGPRSALFTPFPNLGLIVIDEEHEGAYKSEQTPRYHAREVAVQRAKLEGASVILGSATPSLEAYYRAKEGIYTLLELQNRAQMQEMPNVEVVDLREELRDGNRSIISDRLKDLIEERLLKKEQIMLFLNRRGYSGFISCRACGHVVKCPHCDVSMSAHNNQKLICHYCGHYEKKIVNCPICGSKHIGEFRAGTQQIEEVVKTEFKGARVLRMDTDTTKGKDGHEQILATFANEEADILIGTQMIVKGHDFPKVTLVGILAADLSLYVDDYRACERTFQLLTQAAGRAGRGNIKGKVVIQTYSPDHYSIQAAKTHDYKGFYEEEIEYRELCGYPPVDNLLAILMLCEEETLLERASHYLGKFATRVSSGRLTVIGPGTPFVSKINDAYRRTLYIKARNNEDLVLIKNKLEQYIEVNKGFQKVQIQFDFNPMQTF